MCSDLRVGSTAVQVMLLSQALSQRSTILADVERNLADLEGKIKLIQWVCLSFSLCNPIYPFPTGTLLSSLTLRSAAKFSETGAPATGPGRLDSALDAVRTVRSTTARNARVMMILGSAVLGDGWVC